VTNQTGAALEQNAFIPAFTDTISPPNRRRRTYRRRLKSTRSCGRRTSASDSRSADARFASRQPPLHAGDPYGDPGGADPASSALKCDLAFQHAMRCAIAQGLEHPAVGIVKDRRPLTAPRLFEPVPHDSGCTSPAGECADLAGRHD
jgi:hypothetical protein